MYIDWSSAIHIYIIYIYMGYICIYICMYCYDVGPAQCERSHAPTQHLPDAASNPHAQQLTGTHILDFEEMRATPAVNAVLLECRVAHAHVLVGHAFHIYSTTY